MDEIKYIDDPRGGRVPLTDAHGNLTVDAMFLYNKQLISEEGKKLIDEMLANDEMARDALEGYALMANAKEAKASVGAINRALGTEKEAVVTPIIKIDYKKLSAAAAVLLLIGLGGFVGVKFIGQNQLADNTIKTKSEKAREQDKPNKPSFEVEKTALDEELEPLEQADSHQQNEHAETPDGALLDKSKLPVEERKMQERTETPGLDKTKDAREINNTKDDNNRDELLNKLASLKERKNDLSKGSKNQNETKALVTVAGNTISLEDDFAASPAPEPTQKMDEVAFSQEEDERREASRLMVESASSEMQRQNSRRAKKESSMDASEYAESEEAEEAVYSTNEVDQVPRFPGGDLELFRFIEKRKIHPPNLETQGVEGEVFISFQLDANGTVSNVKPLRSDNSQMEADAIRVIRSMPNWQAAQKGGYPVTVKKTLLIKYKIKE